jgi:hypothetical protein
MSVNGDNLNKLTPAIVEAAVKVERYSPIDNTKILSNCVKELFQSALQLIVLHSSLVRQIH